ncbi:obscurin-like [Podarcis muralis]
MSWKSSSKNCAKFGHNLFLIHPCFQYYSFFKQLKPNTFVSSGPPYMQVTIEDVQVRCGEMAKFHAIIEGDPQPTIAWFKGISLLTDSERVHQLSEGTRYSLILYNTRTEDGGVYTCIAKNTGGEVLCKAELVVQEDKKSQEAKKQSNRRKLHSFYEVKQEIGRGSFGLIKRVVHKGNRVSCAAKFIALRSKTRDQAYQERDILATLSHDRITQLLDQFETRKTLILILELCSNEELLDRLFRKNVVTEAEVKFYFRQLLEGIEYLHKNKVLHLDIKPANILMVYDDRDDIKICDFGFAQKINPSEPQYSKYGSPEFVSPEILSQSPVSTASDIWPVGVICYLSLTCKSPFAGENDRATLLNIQNGTVSWDIPDFVHLSKEAQDFIRTILQPSPEARPSAMACLSHTWFMHNLPLEEAHFIDTKQLKFFVSRSKWQRSLMSYKSVLVMRPIPEILEKTQKTTSLGISRHLLEESSSSSTSGSSSDNEISASTGRRHFGPTPGLHLSVLEGSDYPEYQESIAEAKNAESSLPPLLTRPKQASAKREQGDRTRQESEELMPRGPTFDRASSQDKAGLLVPGEGEIESTEAGRSPGCVPRHSVIKSTFYSQPSESLADVPSSPGKEHRKHLERAKRTYRKAGYSKSALSGLREPLLEQFELGEGGLSGDEETEWGREGGAGPLMTKSASFDTAQKSPRVTFQVSSRSRSLDDYKMRATSFAEEQYIEEEESDLIPEGSAFEACSEKGSEKTSAKEGSKEIVKGEVPFAQRGEGHSSSLAAQQQGKALISTPPSEKGEGLLQKPGLPLATKPGTSTLGREDLALTAQQSDLAPKGESEERRLPQTFKAPLCKDTIPILPKGESSDLRVTPPETAPLVSQDSGKGKGLPHNTMLSSVQGKEGPAVLQGPFKSGDQLPEVPSLQGQQIQQVVKTKGKSPGVLQTTPVVEGSLVLHQKPSEVLLESKSSSLFLVSVPGGKEQQILPQKPSAPSQAKSAALKGKGTASLTISQAKAAPVSNAEPKHSHQTPPMHSEMKVPVREGDVSAGLETLPASISVSHGESQKPPKSFIHSKAVAAPGETREPSQQADTVQALIHEGEHHKHPQQRHFAPGKRKLDAFPGERQILMASQGKAVPISLSEPEKRELIYRTQLASSEDESVFQKDQGPSVSGFSQARVVPFSASGGEIPVTQKETPYSIGQERTRGHVHKKPAIYSDTEAEALEYLVDEMVCLSKEMTALAESVSDPEGSRRHISPSREVFYPGSPEQAVRPATRYLVRRGKREGGIGLADPSEADIIYPGEEEYFSVLPSMGKKARMSPPFEGMGYVGAEMPMVSDFGSSGFGDRFSYYCDSQRSDQMCEIRLVQIQDLSEDMPRPDSKTAKFDISEVEPAFLNLYELYDIVYFPFEFLSFRKAPENLPSKRRLPMGEKAKLLPGLKSHAHQDKKICARDDNLKGEAVQEAPRDEEKTPPELDVEPKEAKAPRLGNRSDSEGNIPAGSQQIYGLLEDPAKQRRSSLQDKVGLFKPFVRSQSVELVEQSLKKKVKASVTHLSRMLTRKSSSDQESREGSEERKGELQERASLTEASGGLKKKTGFPSFTLPSLKTKEKAPYFAEELTDQTIALGQSLTLSCRTSAHSSPNIEWFKDGAAIRSTDRILISSTLKHFQLLTILAATSSDFGTYTCVATNTQGTVSTSCVIRKAETPSNPPSPDIVEVLEDGVELAWKPVELNTPVTYSVLCKKDDGEWKTLASDISECCYTAEHLPRGLVLSFRFACVSKSGVGPYSNPTAKVRIGDTDPAAFQSVDQEDSQMTAPAQPTHQTYAFQTEIKRGRFSIIKQCREKLSGNALAAKIIPYRQEDKEDVLQEYHILRKLHHTNIGQLQGAYVSPRHLVLITELCVGPELLNALAGRSSYSEVEVRDYLWQILSAVEYLHAQNILHLDLRSENMIITEPNLLKLLDFGNAQLYEPDRIITLDGCTDYVETMASELLADKGAVPQTDIWAVGVTAFIMLSAEYPISSEAACDFGRLVKREKIKFNKCYAGLSGGAVSFLQSTLSSNPWRRPTASECLQSPWLQETGLDERQQATVTFSTTKLRNFLAERERKRALLCSKYGVMTV